LKVLARNNAIGRISALLLTAAAALSAGSAEPAVAQGLFDSLFGFQPRYVRPDLPPHANSYADPGPSSYRSGRRYGESTGYAGRGTSFCVRTCDGRYFPIQRHAGTTPAELCRSFCPASKTMVFSGGKIDYAVAPNGVRYADLDNAFVYRDKLVPNCTCNGKDPYGLAHVNTMTDPTLRPGDIVATNDGLVTYRGHSNKTAEFSPINPSSSAWAQRLYEIKIRPALGAEPADVAPQADDDTTTGLLRKNHRRVQAAR
jgi:hypothetical protein